MNDRCDASQSQLARVRDSFALQGAMRTVGASLLEVAPGAVDIGFLWDGALTQHNGYVHAGMLATVMDSACGYAALSVMPLSHGVLSVEFKINLLARAQGPHFRCEGRVIKTGRTIVVAEGKAWGWDIEGREKLIATMGCTLMAVAEERTAAVSLGGEHHQHPTP